jgi:hypothetical protein
MRDVMKRRLMVQSHMSFDPEHALTQSSDILLKRGKSANRIVQSLSLKFRD